MARSSLKVARALLRWRGDAGGVANIADSSSRPSTEISAALLESLGIADVEASGATGQGRGAGFEAHIQGFLAGELAAGKPELRVESQRAISEFAQYEHLARVRKLIDQDETGLLREAVGTDYLIQPDVVVALPQAGGLPLLHAAVSCKWTIRSDRVQNVRHEAVMLIRHRRGRVPHIVAVTAEPLPARLASIAQGTGELDCVYHIALPELLEAAGRQKEPDHLRQLRELAGHGRLADLSELPARLGT
jgi:hypothetical protein